MRYVVHTMGEVARSLGGGYLSAFPQEEEYGTRELEEVVLLQQILKQQMIFLLKII